MKTIAIIGLSKDKNIGDSIICQSLCYICKSLNTQNNYKILDLKGRCSHNDMFFRKHIFLYALNSLYHRISKKHANTVLDRIVFNKYLNSKLKAIDLIIFAGGGILECYHYDCDFYIDLITKYAKKKSVPIIYNAVGTNGHFIVGDARYEQLKQNVNDSIVRQITVRENKEQIETYFLQRGKKTELVCDPAVWSADAYAIQANKDSKIIGIGVIRSEIFNEFGINMDEQRLLELYSGLIRILNEKKIKWQIFTNGSKSDYDFGVLILKNLKYDIDNEYIKPFPESGQQFLMDISSYKAIVCARMHASICSYSLKIPSVAICWNPKQIFFYQNIGYPERCMKVENLTPHILFLELEKSIKTDFEEYKYERYRQTIKDSLIPVIC